LTERTRKLSEN